MLHLHIGIGKGGSTTIQDYLNLDVEDGEALHRLRSTGERQAWKLGVFSGSDYARHYWVGRLGILDAEGFARIQSSLMSAIRAEVVAHPAKLYIASSEHVHSNFGSDRASIQRLHDGLTSIFGEVTILMYCREQISWMKSYYAQQVNGRGKSTQSFSEFVQNMDDLRPQWDYFGTLSIWAEVFGKDAVDVVALSPAGLIGGALLTDYRTRTGLLSQSPTERRWSNPSPRFGQLRVLRVLNGLRGGRLQRVVRPIEGFVRGRGARLFEEDYPTDFDTFILDKVSDSNHLLNTTFLDGSGKLPSRRA